MKTQDYDRLLALQTSRRNVLKGAGATAATLGAAGVLGTFSGSARAQDNLRAEILQIPGVGKGSPTDADWQKVGELCLGADQGERQGGRVQGRRAHLHGAQQPEPAQPAVPRLPEAVGGLYRRQDHLDRSRPGRLQPAPAAGDRDRHRRLRHHRDGRALRGRRLRQGPGLGDAGLGQEADRYGRLCRLPEGAGRHLERQDLPHLHRRRLPQLQLPHRLLLRPDLAKAWKAEGGTGRMGRAEDLAAGPGGDQVPQGQEDRAARTPTAISIRPSPGAASASTSWAAAPPPMPSIPTTRPGCSTSTR